MKKKQQRLLLGAHMSIAGGLNYSIQRGELIGCTTIQIFTKSNRQWQSQALTEETIETFKEAQKNSTIQPVIAHATYLINIGSPEQEIEKKSVEALSIELQRCQSLDIPYLVLHPGSATDRNEDACLERISKNLDKVFSKNANAPMILLETMAGQGTSVCYKFEHINQIIKHSEFKNKLGVCFDTCHAFAAGYDFRTKEGYQKTWEDFEKIIGIDRLKVFHINDSAKNLASRIDRHEEIGEGKIGLEAFKYIFNDPRFFDIPKILETPQDTLEDYKKNMSVIVNLITQETEKFLNYPK